MPIAQTGSFSHSFDSRSNMTRTIIVDDHPIVREGLAKALEAEPDIQIVGKAGTVPAARRLLRQASPDVLVLDLSLGDDSGMEFLREIRADHSKVRVLVLTFSCEADVVRRAFAARAEGYMLKEEPVQAIASAIRAIGAGERVWNGRVADALADAMDHRESEQDRLGGLTYQEQRIVERVARGLTNREIAREIRLSDKTVRNYLSGVMQKLGVRRRAEVAAIFAGQAPRAARRGQM